MSATNSTANYSLPIFVSSDVPSWLTDWNGAMGDIDTAIAAAKAVADSALLASGNNSSDITTIQGQITSLQTTVGTHTTQIGTISGNINTINSLIGNGTPTTTDQTIIGAINELHANQGDLTNLTTTNKSSFVAAINEINQGGGATDMTGATASDPGTHGLVPAPAAGDQNKYLKGDGTWDSVATGGRQLIYTAAAGTFGTQLSNLKTEYNNLTAEQKMNSVIVWGSEYIHSNGYGFNGGYCQANGNMAVIDFNFTTDKVWSIIISTSGNTTSDLTATNNSGTIELYA